MMLEKGQLRVPSAGTVAIIITRRAGSAGPGSFMPHPWLIMPQTCPTRNYTAALFAY